LKISLEVDLDSYWRSISGAVHSSPWIFIFLALLFAAHMMQIPFPPRDTIFDETYYIPASQMTLQGIGTNAEQMPLPRIIGAIGIALLGNNWFGYRFPQVVMQIIALYLFYLLARRFLGDPWGLGATMLLGFDTVFFIHGGALLLDMPLFLFGFLAFELYFRKHYWASAVAMGLTLFSREVGILYFLTLAIYHLATNLNKQVLKHALIIGLRYTLIALIVSMSLLTVYDAAFHPVIGTTYTTIWTTVYVWGGNGTVVSTYLSTSVSASNQYITNPVQHLSWLLNYHTSFQMGNVTYHPYRYAYNWISPIDLNGNHSLIMFNTSFYYRLDVFGSNRGVTLDYTPIWYQEQGNLALWYGIWPAMGFLVYALIAKPQNRQTAVFILSGILVNYLPWVFWTLSGRLFEFSYYMIWSLPFIAMGLAFAWKQLPEKYGKDVLALNVFLAFLFFIWFFPIRSPFP
jgi:4-amino-4-deoxy-L-arabinose transferase-like glycosyltransferase